MRGIDRKDVESILYRLDTLGSLSRTVDEDSRVRWVVNPEVHRLFAARASEEAARRQKQQEAIKLDGMLRAEKG